MHERFFCPYEGCPMVCKSQQGLTYHVRYMHFDANRVEHDTPKPLSPLPPPPSTLPLSPLLLPYTLSPLPLPSPHSHSLPTSLPSPLPLPHSPPPHPQIQRPQEHCRKNYHPFLTGTSHICSTH